MIKRLLLLVFAALAVAMAVPSTRAEIRARAITPVFDAIGTRLVPRRLEAMANQLDVRLGRAERLPDPQNFGGWIRRDYSGPETDPWGRPWYIRPGRGSYTVGSTGPDGEQGTPDDITESRRIPGGR